jgi:cell division protein FtsI/penicillin-binding protein 2
MAPDGRVLALAGRRTEAPKGGPDGTKDWHLATDAWAPAASVFKLVTASALVSAGVDPDDKVCFHGGIRSVMESNLHDDKRDNQCESLAFGVAHSNNAIVGKLAYQRLEPDTLAHQAHAFGLDATLGDLPGVAGAIAIPKLHDLDFAKTAAGFSSPAGSTQLTAVGGALLAATFADGGEQPAARLVDSIVGGGATPAVAPHRVVTADVAKQVSRMMGLTCDIGSASKSFGKRRALRVAGKTGTLTKTEPFYMEHSWFVGYAPAEKPQIVVSVVLGNPENWHLRGQEAAKRLIDRALAVPSDEGRKQRSRAPRRS